MLVAGRDTTAPLSTSSSRPHHPEYPVPAPPPPFFAAAVVPPPQPAQPPQQQQQPQLNLALEGRSILLQQRVPLHGTHPQQHAQQQAQPHGAAQLHRSAHADQGKTFSPLQLQLRIDLLGEQGGDPLDVADERAANAAEDAAGPAAPLSRRQRAQLRRRQEQQKPADQVVYQRRTPTRPRTPAACPRTPLAMSTMSMPAAGQKFAADDAAAVFGSAEEASVAVKRLLAKTTTSSVTEEHRVTSSSAAAMDYLQDSFDFLHQRHVKNLSDVIARHQRQQLSAVGQDEQQVHGLTPSQSQQSQQSTQSTQSQRHKKQVHIHQSAFYDGQGDHHVADMSSSNGTFKSTKTINLSNNNSSSNNSSSSDLEDARSLQQQHQQKRCVRENSTSSVHSQSSVSSAHSNSFDNCNNNFCDAVSVSNKANTTKMSSKSSTSSTSSSSSTTRVKQSFSSSSKIVKQSFSSSSQDFEDRIGIDVMLTPSLTAPDSPIGTMVPSSPVDSVASASSSTRKVKQTTKVSSSSSVASASSDQVGGEQAECKQSFKSSKSKTVTKSVSDGRQVHTDVDQFAETAEEEAEGSPDKPTITFSHVSSEGSHQSFTNDIVRFDSSTLSSPSRSRSPSPLLEMPAPYNDLSKEIKRPPMEKA